MSKLMIWDIDGTLMHCFGSGAEAIQATYLELYGIDNVMEDMSLAGIVDRQLMQSINEKYHIENFEEMRFLDCYRQHLIKAMVVGKSPKLVEGIIEVLEDLQRPGLYHVIGTGNCLHGAEVKLELTGLSKYFEYGAYGDEVDSRSQLVKLARSRAEEHYRTKFNDLDVLVIGDTPGDIQSAKDNHFISIATTTGYYEFNQLQPHAPDYIISHFKELIGVIDNHWPKSFFSF